MTDIVFYASKTEKDTVIATAKAKGFSIIHDDFIDDKGQTTDGSAGRLTLDLIVKPADTLEQTTLKTLLAKLESKTITNSELLDLLKLKLLG